MNKKNILAYLSLLVLIIAFANTASATYYYTDEYFKEHFAISMKPAAPKLQNDVMMYVDSGAYVEKYGRTPTAKPPQKELPIGPEAETAGNATNESGVPEVIVVPVAENATNQTGVPEVIVVPVAENATNRTGNGTLEQNGTAENATGGNEKAGPPSLVVSGEEAGKLAASEAGGNASQGNGSLTATGAQVSGGGMPTQVIVIGFLVIVIIVMLVVLLTREDKGEKWEEGDFFKEAKKGEKGKGKKKARKKKEGKKEKQSPEGKSPVKKGEKERKKGVEDKKKPAEGGKEEKGKEEAPAEEKEKGKKQNKEVKPFLLKIKEGVD